MKHLSSIKILSLLLITLIFPLIWLRGGFNSIFLDVDLQRDLAELSNIWQGQLVWLGPRLSPGFHASPVYYYLFYPALYLARGNPRSIIICNILIAAFAIALFAWFHTKKKTINPLSFSILNFLSATASTAADPLSILLLSLLPWWQQTAIHPGNGYTYTFFLFISLTLLWFKKPLWLASLFLGTAIALHPAAIFALPIFLYELWTRSINNQTLTFRNLSKNIKAFAILVSHFSLLLLPWFPIILFEIITKGFLTRQWLQNPSTGIKLELNFHSLQYLVEFFQVPLLIVISLLVISLYLIKKQTRHLVWTIIAILSLLFFTSISPVPHYYLLGATTILTFVLIINFSSSQFGKKILLTMSIYYLFYTITHWHLPIPIRTIPQIENQVQTFLQQAQIDPAATYAVISASGDNNLVPQANDYRFFLRTQGYHVVSDQAYHQADYLIMFVEDPNFDWQSWSTWELEQFGPKTLLATYPQKNINIALFHNSP